METGSATSKISVGSDNIQLAAIISVFYMDTLRPF